MKNIIQVSKAYCINGKIKNSLFELRTNDFEKFKKNVIASANFKANLENSPIRIQETEISIYIDYLDVTSFGLVDVMYLKN